MRTRKPRPRPAARAGHTASVPPSVNGGERPASERDDAALRADRGGIWLYGRHTVLAAAANPRRRLRRLLAVGNSLAEVEAAAARAGTLRPPAEPIDRETLARLLPPHAVHQGMAALADPLAAPTLDELIDRPGPLPSTLIVLDQAEDPRNVGAVVRAAAAFGAAAVIVQDRHAPVETAALAKAASGGLETLPVIRVVNIARALRDLADAGYCCVGLDGQAETPLSAALPAGPAVLVLGAEGHGLRRLVRAACHHLARIPIAAHVDSLNVSAAAAVALYERARAAAAADRKEERP